MTPSIQIAVVTGASSGIGAVYADRLTRRRYDLLLVARREDRLRSLAAKLEQAYEIKTETLVADLEQENDLARLESVLAGNPAFRILVNNAGIARLSTVAESPVRESLAQIALNIAAVRRLTHAVLPAFKERNEGVIIYIASALPLHALPVSSVYSGMKGFMLNFSRGLQQELANTGIRVQVVLPAATATDLWDVSGVPLAALAPETVMPVEHLVDAAFAGFDQGESAGISVELRCRPLSNPPAEERPWAHAAPRGAVSIVGFRRGISEIRMRAGFDANHSRRIPRLHTRHETRPSTHSESGRLHRAFTARTSNHRATGKRDLHPSVGS